MQYGMSIVPWLPWVKRPQLYIIVIYKQIAQYLYYKLSIHTWYHYLGLPNLHIDFKKYMSFINCDSLLFLYSKIVLIFISKIVLFRNIVWYSAENCLKFAFYLAFNKLASIWKTFHNYNKPAHTLDQLISSVFTVIFFEQKIEICF